MNKYPARTILGFSCITVFFLFVSCFIWDQILLKFLFVFNVGLILGGLLGEMSSIERIKEFGS